MNRRILACMAGMFPLFGGVPAWGGNAALMEGMRAELVEINERVLGRLDAGVRNGRIRVEARLEERDGKAIIVVDRMDTEAGTFREVGEEQPEGEEGRGGEIMVFSRCQDDCESAIRHGVFPRDFESALDGNRVASTDVKPARRIELEKELLQLSERYPGLHSQELNKRAIEVLSQQGIGSGVLGGGALLLYW